MGSCIKNTRTKNYQNPMIGFHITVESVGDVFWDTVYVLHRKQEDRTSLFVCC